MKLEKKRKIYSIYCWAFLVFNIYTILGGAFVRATGSGAGCGDHWPLCGNSWVPNLAFFHTLIEFTHRISSALVTIGVLFLLVGAFLCTSRGNVNRKCALFSCLFVFFEALLGAALVKFKLVEQNSSALRALVMVLHLVNTFLLLGSLSLCAAWASKFPVFKLNLRDKKTYLALFSIFGLCFIGATGALTALGIRFLSQTMWENIYFLMLCKEGIF